MVQVTIEFDPSRLQEMAGKVPQIKERGLSYATQGMIAALMKNSPVDHGLLRQWFVDSMTADESHIRTPAKYARFVNDGTAPYIIEPKGIATYHAGQKITSGSALWWEGADHPVRRVRHPGIKGQHFVEDSINEVQSQLEGFFIRAMHEVLE